MPKPGTRLFYDIGLYRLSESGTGRAPAGTTRRFPRALELSRPHPLIGTAARLFDIVFAVEGGCSLS